MNRNPLFRNILAYLGHVKSWDAFLNIRVDLCVDLCYQTILKMCRGAVAIFHERHS